jgi:hypothetical protein
VFELRCVRAGCRREIGVVPTRSTQLVFFFLLCSVHRK